MSNSSVNYWLIVDTVRIPDAINILNQHMAVEQALPLFAGSDFDYLLESSPLVVNLGHHASVLETWQTLPYFDSSSIILELELNQSSEALMTHLQSLLQVYINQETFLLRFYSNTLWNKVASSLNEADIITLSGPARAIYWMDETHTVQYLYQPHTAQSRFEQTPPYSLTSPVFKQWL